MSRDQWMNAVVEEMGAERCAQALYELERNGTEKKFPDFPRPIASWDDLSDDLKEVKIEATRRFLAGFREEVSKVIMERFKLVPKESSQ